MAEHEAIITADKPVKVSDSESEQEEETGTYLGDDLSIGETVCNADIVEILQSRDDIPDWLKDIRAVISEFYVSKSEVTIEEATLVVETESAVDVPQVKEAWKPMSLASWGNSKEEGDKSVKHRSKSKAKSSESAYTQLSSI